MLESLSYHRFDGVHSCMVSRPIRGRKACRRSARSANRAIPKRVRGLSEIIEEAGNRDGIRGAEL